MIDIFDEFSRNLIDKFDENERFLLKRANDRGFQDISAFGGKIEPSS